MWSATKPTEVGRYGWRPSPAEPGRIIDIADIVLTGKQFAFDATGHVVEGGEWWQGPVYAWEQVVSAETASEAFKAWKSRCDQSDGFRPCAESFEVGFEAGRAAEPVSAELLAAAKQLRNAVNAYRINFGDGHGHLKKSVINAADEAIARAEQQPADTRDAEIARMRAALEACIAYMPCSEVHNWPPGFRLKDNAIKLARAALGEKS